MDIRTCPALDPTGRDLHGEAARLRAEGPAVEVELPGGVQAWSVTRYEVIKHMLTGRLLSKDPRRHWPAWINGEIPPDWPMIVWVGLESMFTAHGADHVRLRKLVTKEFTRSRVEDIRPGIERITADLLDAMVALGAGERGTPGGPVDLRRTFADPLPTRVICDLFGVPEDARHEMHRALGTALATAATPQQAARNAADLHAVITALVSVKREHPGGDLTSALIAARDDGDGSRLTEAELVSTLIVLIGGGSETAVNLITNATAALLTHPEQLALVLEGYFSWNDVIEETLRAEPPIVHQPLYFATADIELSGVKIRRGDAVLVGFGAAGRDPAVHGVHADRFDITRPDKNHLAFGHGMHFCIGAHLARLEAGIALPALFGRFPDMTLAMPPEGIQQQESFIANGHSSLPVLLKR
ncbi:cytochrome P450 [Streptomyces noursei]|uniref:cytochrome P450 family protein n=1 Tax=Streptomyces noursei TaxID=1971 RepID=UPI0033D47EA7